MKIVVVNKDKLENIPPLISVIYHLNNLGHEIHVITTGYKDATAQYFKENNIASTIVPDNAGKNVFQKAIGYYEYRKKVSEILNSLSFDCIWIEGGNTILALGNIIKKYRFILQISELYENSPRIFSAIRKVIKDASHVVLPEYNRAILYKIWFSLLQRPTVLPNIPAFLPTEQEIANIEKRYSEKLEKLKNKNVILYQGHIGEGRDLTSFAQAIQELGDDYVLLLVGKDHNTVATLKQICSRVLHIDFIPAPDYLVFTKHSDIGILSYDSTSINNVYCAPNKLYEYASYGLPMLGNDIPGLKYTLEFYNAGVIIDEKNVVSIKNAISSILNNKELYQKNSRRLFESFNNMSIVSNIIKNIDVN